MGRRGDPWAGFFEQNAEVIAGAGYSPVRYRVADTGCGAGALAGAVGRADSRTGCDGGAFAAGYGPPGRAGAQAAASRVAAPHPLHPDHVSHAGDISVVEPRTYLYYIQTQVSR